MLYYCSLKDLRQGVQSDHAQKKKEEFESGPKASYGYGGQFGVQKDRMDQVADCYMCSCTVEIQ